MLWKALSWYDSKLQNKNLLQLCHKNLVLYSLINGKSHPNKIPACPDSRHFFENALLVSNSVWDVSAIVRRLLLCTNLITPNGLYFQSRLETRRAMFLCVCGGVMGGMQRQLQTLQWHGCNGADWSPVWLPAGPAGFSIQQTPNPPSLRHHRHHRSNLQDPPSPIDFNLATVLTLEGFTSTHLRCLTQTASNCYVNRNLPTHLSFLINWHFPV